MNSWLLSIICYFLNFLESVTFYALTLVDYSLMFISFITGRFVRSKSNKMFYTVKLLDIL